MTAFYKLAGKILASDFDFPELAPTKGDASDYTFSCEYSVSAGPAPNWYHLWELRNGHVWLLLGRSDSDYVLRFPGMADFRVSPERNQVKCQAVPDLAANTIRHLFLDQVFPLLLASADAFVLHASGVEVTEGALVIVGSTGAGKSTLAASFGRNGHRIITDDFLLVRDVGGKFMCTPSYPGIRLVDDSLSALARSPGTSTQVAHYTDKFRLDASTEGVKFADKPVPLWRVCILDSEKTSSCGPVEINPISPRQALITLAEYSFYLDITDRDLLAQQFELLARVATLPLFYEVRIRRDFASLPAVLAKMMGAPVILEQAL